MFKKHFLALTLTMAATQAMAQQGIEYEVAITNLSPGQSFTPQLVVTHPGNVRLFRIGNPARETLEILAEGGDTAPLAERLAPSADEVKTVDGLLGPGQTVTTTITATDARHFLSIAAMMIPTNDTFMALNRARLPVAGSATFTVPAYDAGSEANDQDCANIPGPTCGGVGYVGAPAEGDEGFVHVSNGMHDLGGDTLSPAIYDWRNPVARITVRRMR